MTLRRVAVLAVVAVGVYGCTRRPPPEAIQPQAPARVDSSAIIAADVAKGTRRLLTNLGNNEDPSWGPDGRHLVFASKDREGGGLFVLDTVSGRVRTLLRGAGYGLPDWSDALYRATTGAAR